MWEAVTNWDARRENKRRENKRGVVFFVSAKQKKNENTHKFNQICIWQNLKLKLNKKENSELRIANVINCMRRKSE